MKSIYLHYEEKEKTIRFDLTGPKTVKEVLDEFQKKVSLKELDDYNLRLLNEGGKIIAGPSDLNTLCSKGDDFFVEIKSKKGEVPKKTPFPTTMPANIPENQREEWELLQKYLAAGKDAFDKGVFQRSIEIYEKLQETVPREPQSAKGLAESYEMAGRWKDACKTWEHYISLTSEHGNHLVSYARALQKIGETEKAFSMVKDVLKDIDSKADYKKLSQDMKVRLGHLYATQTEEDGAQQAAAALFSNVLQETEQKHIDAMLGYTDVC